MIFKAIFLALKYYGESAIDRESAQLSFDLKVQGHLRNPRGGLARRLMQHRSVRGDP